MYCPLVGARVEETNEAPCLLYDRSDIAAFRPIAKGTDISQVVSVGLPTVLFTDDMIDLAAKEGIFFIDQTILAETFGPYRHKPAQGCVNVAAHGPDGCGHEPWLVALCALT